MTYIFDFDGTLVDSMKVFADSMVQVFDENNLSYPEDVVKIITPLGYKGTAEYALSLGLDMTVEQFIEQVLESNKKAYHDTIPAKPFVKEKLTELKAQGHSLNVLTASPHMVLDKCLERVGLYDLFDNIWSCDDFNCSKSETKIYVEAAKRLNKRVDECIFVDDNIGAVTTAKRAGMVSVGIYDDSSAGYAEDMKKAADRYIMNFKEL